jgi:hypothetical protein
VIENRVLRRIFGTKRDEVTGEWRRYEELTKYCFGDQIKKNEIGGTCSMCGQGRGAYRMSVGIPDGRRPLGRPKRRWEGNIKMDLQEVGWGMEWIELA